MMTKDVRELVQYCDVCQQTNDAKFCKAVAPLHSIQVKPKVWKMVGIDIVGPLPVTAKGNRYILTLVDYFSKWPEAEALPTKSAKEVALFLYRIMCRFGSTEVIISDQGREFINAVTKHLFSLTGTEHRISSAYHPQTNGLVERFNQTLQKSLLKLVKKEQDDWDEYIDGVLFAYRTCIQKSSGTTPFEIMYCRKPVLPIELDMLSDSKTDSGEEANLENYISRMQVVKSKIYKKAHENIQLAQIRQKKDYDKKLKKKSNLKPGTLVLMRNSHRDGRKNGKLEKRYSGPYSITECLGKGIYKLSNTKTGKVLNKTVNGFRLKKYYSAPVVPQLTADSVYQFGSSDDDSILQLPVIKTKKSRKQRVLESSTDSNEELDAMPDDAMSVSNNTSIGKYGYHQDLNSGDLSPVPNTKCASLVTSIATVNNSPEDSSPITVSDEMSLPPSPKTWKKNLLLTLKDKQDLTSGQWLNDKFINAAQELLKIQFPSQNGLQDTVVLEAVMKFPSPCNNFVQIIHVEDHWVCASNLFSPEGYVDVYDSMPTLTMNSHCLQLQLAAILKYSKNSFIVRHINVQRQIGGSECGLFAISFATSLCMGFDPHTQTYQQDHMRSHFLQCIENFKLNLFPSGLRKHRLGKSRLLSEKEIQVYCICRLPWNKYTKLGPLVQCNICKEWYHQKCCNIDSDILNHHYHCHLCSN